MRKPQAAADVAEFFRCFAKGMADFMGTPWAFAAAALVVLVWAVSGHFFHYSDTWQLVINTGTTIVTFLMVFLMQNTQNRDAKAIHLKLDELLRGVRDARTGFVHVEDLTENELADLSKEFDRVKRLPEPMASSTGKDGETACAPKTRPRKVDVHRTRPGVPSRPRKTTFTAARIPRTAPRTRKTGGNKNSEGAG
ncbi:MAG TPA: low affinity iron permease family protein [Methylomirabilota bacterium]|nr:low affinity iron permease family protein [Methylomirabilota bacterium]